MTEPTLHIRKALDKIQGVASKKVLLQAITEKNPSKSAHYKSFKFPKMPAKPKFGPSFSELKNKNDKATQLKEKTKVLPKTGEEPSVLSEKALQTSHFCAGERQIRYLLATLREKDFGSLGPDRCTPWRFRERHLAEANLKNVKKSLIPSKAHSFTSLSAKEEEKKEEYIEEKEKWEEINRMKEDPHFHLNRVVKYLTK